MDWQITNATLVEPGNIQKTAGLVIGKDRIESVLSPGEEEDGLLNLNLHGLQVFAGLLNGHDSLLATFEKYAGMNRPYTNWLAWDNELKSSNLFRRRMLLSVADLYQLGAYKNIMNGATTVLDHIPESVRAPFAELVLTFLPQDYAISHSISSYSLGWGDGHEIEAKQAKKRGIPHVLHIAEGFDPESKASLQTLHGDGSLSDCTVLTHGLSLSDQDLDLIADAEASIVWCPISSAHIYDAQPPIEAMRDRGINVCLGSDAAMYGSPGLFSDIRAAATWQGGDGAGIPPAEILAMATENVARALRLKDRGSLTSNSAADLLILRGRQAADPYASFATAEPGDVYLVVRSGLPVYGDARLEPIFVELGVLFDRFSVRGRDMLVARYGDEEHEGLRSLLRRIELAAGDVDLSFLPVVASPQFR